MNVRTSLLLVMPCPHGCQWETLSTPSLGRSRHTLPSAGGSWVFLVSRADTTPTAYDTRQSEGARRLPHPSGAIRKGPHSVISPHSSITRFSFYATRLLDHVDIGSSALNHCANLTSACPANWVNSSPKLKQRAECLRQKHTCGGVHT